MTASESCSTVMMSSPDQESTADMTGHNQSGEMVLEQQQGGHLMPMLGGDTIKETYQRMRAKVKSKNEKIARVGGMEGFNTTQEVTHAISQKVMLAVSFT